MRDDDPVFDRLFLGAGAMKAGTTWLYAVLDTHPELFFSVEKETHYFYARDRDPSVLSPRRRLENARDKYLRFAPERGNLAGPRNRMRWVANYLDDPLDDLWYRNLFAFRRGPAFMCDFSNLTALVSEDMWRRIAARTGQLRVLYTLRDPVRRLWSHAKFHLQVTGEQDKLRLWGPEEFDAFLRRPFIWENAEYGAALRRMRAALPADVLKVAFFEDIHAAPTAFLRDLEAFLGIGAGAYPAELLSRQVNRSASVPMPDFFPGLVARDVRRIVAELRAEGVEPPASWAIP